MGIFEDFLSTLKGEVSALIREEAADCAKEARADLEAFMAGSRADLERWSGLLANGQLSSKDFEFLVRGKADVAEMQALKRIGLEQVRMDRIRNGFISGVVRAATSTFL